MQHAGLQYGQGAANSHQSPPFAHTDISQSNGGNTASSLRQFRKKDSIDKNSNTDLSGVENSHIARVPPHNHYPARPNDYYRYHHQFPEYNSPFKENPAPVKYSEIAETPPQPLQHVDHIPPALQKHKEPHKEFMDMCNLTQSTHMKQNYPEALNRQQSYPPDTAVHHQYLHKEPQVHPNYKPESQYQQYHPTQIPKYNMSNIPSQCRKYPPHENEFLAKLQRINPSMARSIISEHHMRDPQSAYSGMDQARMYQNQRYFPNHMQNNPSYNYHNMPQPYYPSSCNYPRSNQMTVGGAQYPGMNPHSERSLSPRSMNMGMNYGAPPQKVSPNYGQYNAPEYAQHYQHRRTSMSQEYYQQPCRTAPYMPPHQLPPETADNRPSSGIRHFIENWAEEEGPGESLAPIFKDSVRIHNETSNEHVFVIESSTIPQLESVALVPTENGQYIIKSGIDNSVVRIEKPNEDVAERAVNLQIVDNSSKADCMLLNGNILNEESVNLESANPVPYKENPINTNCDEKFNLNKSCNASSILEKQQDSKEDTVDPESSVIVCNEVSVIKDMPLIDDPPHMLQVEDNKVTTATLEPEVPISEEETEKNKEDEKVAEEERLNEVEQEKQETDIDNSNIATEHEEKIVEAEVKDAAKAEDKEGDDDDDESPTTILEKELLFTENHITSSTKRTQRIFSVDDIINTAGAISSQPRRSSLQFMDCLEACTFSKDDQIKEKKEEDNSDNNRDNGEEKRNEPKHEEEEETTYTNAISVEDSSIILEIGGELVQLNLNYYNGTKVLSVLPLSESLVIDVNGNLQDKLEEEKLCENTSSEAEITIEREEHIEKLKDSNDDNLKENSHMPDNQYEILEENLIQADSAKDDATIEPATATLEDEINSDVYHSEVIIGEESLDNDIFINLEPSTETAAITEFNKQEEPNDNTIKISEVTTTAEKIKCETLSASKVINEVQEIGLSNLSDSEVAKEIEEIKLSGKHNKAEKTEVMGKSLSKQFQQEVSASEKNIVVSTSIEEKVESIPIEEKTADMSSTIQSSLIKKLSSSPEGKYADKVLKSLQSVKKKEKKSSKEEKRKNKERNEEKKKSNSSSKALKEAEKHHKKLSKANGEFTSKTERKNKIGITGKSHKILNQDKKEHDKKVDKTSEKVISVEKPKPIEIERPTEKEKVIEKEKPTVYNVSTKAAKKLYETDLLLSYPSSSIVEKQTVKRKSKIEEAVNKIKLLKKQPESAEKLEPVEGKMTVDKAVETELQVVNKNDTNENKEAVPLKILKPYKRVTFSLDTEIREMGKDEMDRKRLSWEEYHSRKRKAASNYEWGESTSKIMEDTVSSTKEISDDVVEEVALSIEKEIETSTSNKSPPRVLVNNWEDPDSPDMIEPSASSRQKKCFIDINEFSIKPIESVSTPSPVSSSQFSYHSEDDSLQLYKNVVDSKLNSLNITIPKKVSKPKPVEHFSVLFERFLNKGSLNGSELEKVRKIIELKRKMIEEQQLTYEVRAERELKDLKLHLKKVPEKRKHKRFRNLYADDSSDDSDSSQSEKEIGDYSVYQRNSQQGVPKLIIKRKSGLPQPFVKLERSHAVDLLAKKRKLY